MRMIALIDTVAEYEFLHILTKFVRASQTTLSLEYRQNPLLVDPYRQLMVVMIINYYLCCGNGLRP